MSQSTKGKINMTNYKLVPVELLKDWHERINTIAAETAFNIADEMESILDTTPDVQSTFTVGTDLSDGKLAVVVMKHENGITWVIHSEVIQLAEQAKPTRQYYYKVSGCKALSPDSDQCICWHYEGEGPLADGSAEYRPVWRNAATQHTPAVQVEPAEQHPIPPSLAYDATRHLTKWLNMNLCECEGGHTCGYNEVQRTRDALLTVAEQKPECGCCGQAGRCDDDCDTVVIGGHRAAEQQAGPDVSGLVEALRSILGWRELRSGPEFPVERVEDIARSALQAHQKQEEGE